MYGFFFFSFSWYLLLFNGTNEQLAISNLKCTQVRLILALLNSAKLGNLSLSFAYESVNIQSNFLRTLLAFPPLAALRKKVTVLLFRHGPSLVSKFILYCTSITVLWIFSSFPHPTPAKPTSLPCLNPPP